MKDRRAIERYAAALFQSAEEKKELEVLDHHLLRTRELVQRHPEISNLLSNSTIALSEKEDFIDKIVPAGISRTLVHFLKVLVKKRRFHELPDIQEEHHRLFEKKKGIREVEAISAVPLSTRLEKKISEILAKKFNSEIRLISKTKPNLIGGFILRFLDRELDASIRGRLEEMRQRLLR